MSSYDEWRLTEEEFTRVWLRAMEGTAIGAIPDAEIGGRLIKAAAEYIAVRTWMATAPPQRFRGGHRVVFRKDEAGDYVLFVESWDSPDPDGSPEGPPLPDNVVRLLPPNRDRQRS
jgi:hypothetical protein